VSAATSSVASGSAQEALFEEDQLGKAYDARMMARLWPFVSPYWPQMLLTLLLLFPLLVLDLLPAWLVKTGLDDIVVPAATGRPPAAAETGLLEALPAFLQEAISGVARGFRALVRPPAGIGPLAWLGVLYFAVSVLGALIQFLDMWIMARTGQAAMRDLREKVFRHVQRLHVGFFDSMPVGRLVTRATNDVENVAEMFSAGIVALVRDVLKMLGIAAFLFVFQPRIALLAFLIVPFMAVAAMVFRWKARNAYRAVRVRIARINAYVQENVSGMRVVQLFRRESRNFQDFDQMNASHRDAWLQSVRYDAALFSAVELASNLTIAVVIWQSLGLAAAGTIYVFFDLMRRFFMPLRDLSAKYSVMQSSMASCERIFELLDAEPQVRDRPGAKAPSRGPQPARVEFRDVWFRYSGARDQDDWVLRDVSFCVEPGERVAFVGATGAGKTTLIKLLTRLYDSTRGTILIDGVELCDWPQAELRRRISLVLQDVFLFSGSIRDNIGLERPEIDAEAVERAARVVQAHDFVAALPRGYAEPLRERAHNLSLGQRQLLSFARALAHGGDILVLDEATSSIDPGTEARVQQGTHALMTGHTALVVAHRLSTIRDVDRIYVLEGGRIVEAGGHEALLALGGVYSSLHRLQNARPDTPALAAS